jgi:DNA-binding MarR family transcriptional regulator
MAREIMRLNENETAWMRLFRTYKILERAREVELAKAGLSLAQAGVLYFLKDAKEPLTPSKLARLMYKEPHTMSGLISRMEAQGLVKKTKNLEKKNLVRVSLTKKGEEAFKRQLGKTAVMNVTSCLSKKDLDKLNVLSDRLRTKGIELLRDMQTYPYRAMLE